MDTDASFKRVLEFLSDGDIEAAIALIEHPDVDINHRDVTHDLQTILMRICYLSLSVTDLERVLAAIFDKSPDVNIQDSWGRTALMHACIANKPGYIEGLLGYEDTDITISDFDGNTALSYAVQNCDIYTMEDILSHQQGGNLVTKHNAKGTCPLTIAQKSGDKSVIALLESYVNKTICLQNKKKQRKPRNRETLRIPLGYSPSPERKSGPITCRPLVNPPISLSLPNSPASTMESFLSPRQSRSKVDLKLDIGEKELYSKSDSAPIVRKDISLEKDDGPCLSLTSARLSRHHYKRDSLRHQPTSLQSAHALPNVDKSSDWETVPNNHLRKQRRPSISLPDLRMAGFLVQSGGSTPTTCSEDEYIRNDKEYDTNSDDDVADEDNVFFQSHPKVISSRSNKTTQRSDRQFTLPEISRNSSNISSKHFVGNKISPLARSRKYSNSDDQLNRTIHL